MHKIVKIALVVIGLIGAVLWFMLPSRELSEANPAEAAQSGPMGAMFMLTYLLLAVAVVFSLGYALKNLFSNPESLKKTLYVMVGFLVAAGIAYVLSSGTDINLDEMARKGVPTTESTVKRIGMGLNLFFILTIIAVGAMLWGGFKKMTSK
tara:strand:- start:6664 stop:7116 length:453 start_codon:yes stop_codon:yes gene_type:complete